MGKTANAVICASLCLAGQGWCQSDAPSVPDPGTYLSALPDKPAAKAENNPPSSWETLRRCGKRAKTRVSPRHPTTEGDYGVVLKRSIGGDVLFVKGCGANASFRKTLKVDWDYATIDFYALHLGPADAYDFVIWTGRDDWIAYNIYFAADNYSKWVEVAADGVYGKEIIRDAGDRHEILVSRISDATCSSGKKPGFALDRKTPTLISRVEKCR